MFQTVSVLFVQYCQAEGEGEGPGDLWPWTRVGPCFGNGSDTALSSEGTLLSQRKKKIEKHQQTTESKATFVPRREGTWLLTIDFVIFLNINLYIDLTFSSYC